MSCCLISFLGISCAYILLFPGRPCVPSSFLVQCFLASLAWGIQRQKQQYGDYVHRHGNIPGGFSPFPALSAVLGPARPVSPFRTCEQCSHHHFITACATTGTGSMFLLQLKPCDCDSRTYVEIARSSANHCCARMRIKSERWQILDVVPLLTIF